LRRLRSCCRLSSSSAWPWRAGYAWRNRGRARPGNWGLRRSSRIAWTSDRHAPFIRWRFRRASSSCPDRGWRWSRSCASGRRRRYSWP
jgi:hypothetical protein